MDNMKTMLMYVLLGITVFFITATGILYMKGETPIKTLFEDWKGWISVVAGLGVAGGSWYYFEKRTE